MAFLTTCVHWRENLRVRLANQLEIICVHLGYRLARGELFVLLLMLMPCANRTLENVAKNSEWKQARG